MIAAPLFCLLTLVAASDPDVRVEQDLPYLGEGRAERLDLYMPAKVDKGQRFPGIVIIHGGGFTGGTKRGAREQNIGTNLAKSGYVCISIDYVLASKDKPTWPQNLYDCKTAVRWLRAHAEKYHVDPNHIGVIGGSAGGHLALMVGLTGPEAGLDPKDRYGTFSCQVQAVVDLYGPGDLVRRGQDHVMLPGTQRDKPDLYKQASPVTYVRKGNPPVLIVHGTKDATVPVEQSQRMAEALKQAGVEHELILVEGAPHSFHLEPKEKDLRPAVIGFFDKHLKPSKGAGAMQLHVNPHELILIGENSFLRLSTDRGQKVSTRCSHWRVLWSPAGAGHVLFVDSGVTDGVRIYADNVPLVRFLQKEIEYLLYKPFSDSNLPVRAATFEREGTPPGRCSEIVRSDKEEIRLSWSEFLEPFNFAADPGYDGRPIGVQTTFFPASSALFSVSGRKAEGDPWPMDRGGKPCTSACLAWCETWFRPK